MNNRQIMTVAPASPFGRTWSTTIVMLMVSLVAAVAGGVFYAPAAAAHGGPYELEVHHDGYGGVEVFAYYEEDGHIVEAIMDPVVTAVSADGVERGPISLISSEEGQGRWISETPFLDTGDWTVTVATTTPEETSTTIEVTVEAQEPQATATSSDPEPSATADDATDPSAQADSADDAEGSTGTVLWIVLGVVLVAAVIGGLLWRRSRR